MAYRDIEKSRAYQRAWYHRNAAKRKATRDNNRARIALWYEELKATLRCLVCGESHPACIVFHHRDERTKRFEISVAVADALSTLCGNCHMKLHWNERLRKRRYLLVSAP